MSAVSISDVPQELQRQKLGELLILLQKLKPAHALRALSCVRHMKHGNFSCYRKMIVDAIHTSDTHIVDAGIADKKLGELHKKMETSCIAQALPREQMLCNNMLQLLCNNMLQLGIIQI